VDAKQFDELIARLAEGPSRRDALKGVLGGTLASLGIGAAAEVDAKKNKGKGKGGKKNKGGDDAEAEKNKHKRRRRRRKAKKCKKGKKHCGNKHKCFNLQTNPNHCGNCGTKCDADQTCIDGICTPIT
jgi:hypothetical protein